MFDFYETYSNYEERVLLEKYKSQDMDKLILQWSSLLVRVKLTTFTISILVFL